MGKLLVALAKVTVSHTEKGLTAPSQTAASATSAVCHVPPGVPQAHEQCITVHCRKSDLAREVAILEDEINAACRLRASRRKPGNALDYEVAVNLARKAWLASYPEHGLGEVVQLGAGTGSHHGVSETTHFQFIFDRTQAGTGKAGAGSASLSLPPAPVPEPLASSASSTSGPSTVAAAVSVAYKATGSGRLTRSSTAGTASGFNFRSISGVTSLHGPTLARIFAPGQHSAFELAQQADSDRGLDPAAAAPSLPRRLMVADSELSSAMLQLMREDALHLLRGDLPSQGAPPRSLSESRSTGLPVEAPKSHNKFVAAPPRTLMMAVQVPGPLWCGADESLSSMVQTRSATRLTRYDLVAASGDRRVPHCLSTLPGKAVPASESTREQPGHALTIPLAGTQCNMGHSEIRLAAEAAYLAAATLALAAADSTAARAATTGNGSSASSESGPASHASGSASTPQDVVEICFTDEGDAWPGPKRPLGSTASVRANTSMSGTSVVPARAGSLPASGTHCDPEYRRGAAGASDCIIPDSLRRIAGAAATSVSDAAEGQSSDSDAWEAT